MTSARCPTRLCSALMMLAATPLLASCAMQAGYATEQQLQDATCAPWSAIYASRQDVLTDGTARQIMQHNETGRALCGWGK